MRSFLNNNSFLSNLSIVISGKTVSFLLSIASTPILARLYQPETYGLFSIFNTIVAFAAIFATLNLSNALLVCKTEERRPIIWISSYASFAISLILLCFAIIAEDSINQYIGHVPPKGFWLLVAATILLKSFATILGSWIASEKAYSRSAAIALSEVIITRLSAVSLGFRPTTNPIGLMLAELIGKLTYFIVQYKLFIKDRLHWLIVPKKHTSHIKLLKTYQHYFSVLMPTTWIVQGAAAVTLFYLGLNYGLEQTGAYGMALSLTSLPMLLIGYSSQTMLIQKMAEHRGDHIHRNKLLNRYLLSMMFIGLFTAICAWQFGSIVILWVLGDNWHLAVDIIIFQTFILVFDFFRTSLEGCLIAESKSKSVFSSGLILLIGSIAAVTHNHLVDGSFIFLIKLTVIYKATASLLIVYNASFQLGKALSVPVLTLLSIYYFAIFWIIF